MLRAFNDPAAPTWLVWTTMLSCLASLHCLLVWTVLAIIAFCQEPPAYLREKCSGTALWGLLVALCVFTLALAAGLYRLLADAQSGMPLPGARWPMERKRKVAVGGATLWCSLWVAAGASSMSGCARDRLGANSVRRMVLVWFWWHTAVLALMAVSLGGDAALLWWRRREVRMARSAYCTAQVGVETSGAGEKVII